MPSFDITSELDRHEVMNAVDQTNRELENRFDFKGVKTSVKLDGDEITLAAPSDFQVQQLDEILRNKLTKRQVDIRSLKYEEMDKNLSEARQVIKLQQGIDSANAKKITKLIKDQKFKVQASIQGDQVRVVGKKRDDLQAVMAFLDEAKLEIPVQYGNFRE